MRGSGNEVVVGIVANPASGRDVRRLVSGASVFDNAEKGAMAYRALAGLGAAGVDRALIMPAPGGVSESLARQLRARAATPAGAPFPHVETLALELAHDARDTVRTVELMRERGVGAIIVLGGDGTHRAVAAASGDVPLCALSTGTNNAFPELREATVAGLAAGLVASGRLGPQTLRREKALAIALDGTPVDLALVDVATSGERWVGARAVWRPETARELVVARASAASIGLSAIAGLIEPVSPRDAHGLHLRLGPAGSSWRTVLVPLAPGLVVEVGIEEVRRVERGVPLELAPLRGSIALDGERELEVGPDDRVSVTVGDGPVTVDVEAAMAEAAARGLLVAGGGTGS